MVGQGAKLLLAVQTASMPGVERALANGAGVDGVDGKILGVLVPPIWLASSCGHVDIVKLLVRRGADLDKATGGRCDSTGAVGDQFDGGTTEMIFGRSRPLHAAIFGGNLEVLRVLLEAGANPNSTSGDAATPLMTACSRNGKGPAFLDAEQRVEALHALLGAGADPTLKTPIGGLAIHYAATIGANEAVGLLLSRVPSTINDIDYTGTTPLGCAARKGHAHTVSFLLSAGAREPAAGWTPGIITMGILHSAVVEDRQEVVRILLSQGLEAIGGVATVPEAMRSSIQLGFIGILRLLLNVQGEDRQGFWANHPVFTAMELITATFPAGTPLCVAHSILAAKSGSPMLHVAAKYCSLCATHVLLSAGADETVADSQGKRASDVIGYSTPDEKKDLSRVSGLRRMLQRGPAFRARSWAWPTGTDPEARVPPATMMKAATSCTRRSSVVRRVFRAKGCLAFYGPCARCGPDCGLTGGEVYGARKTYMTVA